MGKSYLSLPVNFSKIDYANIQDSRFTPTRIEVAHVGRNHNGSVFTKERLMQMAQTLANVPIMGYIQKKEDNTSDFKGHEEILVIDDNGMRFEYLGRAYGVISENHNARFETKLCDDGIEREFLVCDGLLWNRFEEAKKIFDRDFSKSQSMELDPDTYKGHFEDDGYFYFDYAACIGVCVLGEGIQPAMQNATISKYSTSDLQNQINEMMKELKYSLSYISPEEGGTPLMTDEVKVEEKVDEVIEEITEPINEPVIEEVVKEITEEVTPEIIEQPQDKVIEKLVEEIAEPTEFELLQVKFNDLEEKYSKLSLDYETITKNYTDLHSEFEIANKDLVELREFEAKVKKEELIREVDSIISNFTFKEDETIDLREKAINKEIDLETLEFKLYAMVGMKAYKKQVKENDNTTIKFSHNEEKSVYGEAERYFNKK